MSIKVQSYVWENSKATGSALLLLLAIADFAHDDGTGAWPSTDTLAKKCRQSIRNVAYLLRKLEDSGELKTIVAGGPKGCNAYSIPLHLAPANIAPPMQETAPDCTQPLQTRVKTPCKPGPRIAPEPLETVIDEPSLNLSNEVSRDVSTPDDEFAMMFQSIEGAMGGKLTPHECDIVRELWDRRPDFQAHHYAYVQTRDHANGFNLTYYQKSLDGFNGNRRQIQIIRAATFSSG